MYLYRERHDEFLANNITKVIQKSLWSEMFRILPNLWIHMDAIQVFGKTYKTFSYSYDTNNEEIYLIRGFCKP